MDIYETRRRNLQQLADERFPGHGQKTNLAKFMGWTQPRASAILRERDPKNIGGTAARLIEQAFTLPRGWLDEKHQTTGDGQQSVRESKANTYAPNNITRGLPLLNDNEAERWILGERFPVISKFQFPILPMMAVSEDAFVMEETTTSMPPQKPGDFYYVDPLTEPQGGDWAVAVIGDRVVVGIYEKGRVCDRVSFTNGEEAPLNLQQGAKVCKIITRISGDFARPFSAS